MKLMRVATTTVVAAAVAVGGLSAAPAAADRLITNRSFGVHSFGAKPGVPAGTFRMNCWPTWSKIEPRPGRFNWALMDRNVRLVESWGFTDILFTFCGTPAWATGPVPKPAQEVLGVRSTGAPVRMSDWRRLVTRVVQRYRGRIDAYQVWNEATTPQFYQGSVNQMVAMTQHLSQIVRAHSGGARVVSASVQTHDPVRYRRIAVPYFSGLRAAGWPVDVAAGHFYPTGLGAPNDRVRQLRMFRRSVRSLGAPARVQLWDTEVNFATGQKHNPPAGRVSGRRAAAFVARDYLDTWRFGYARSYWYLWSHTYIPFVGVQLRHGDAATRAYHTIARWTIGANYRSCNTRRRIVLCRFRKGGKPFVIVFTTRRTARLVVTRKARISKRAARWTRRWVAPTAGRRKVCPVTGSSCRRARRSVRVGTLPLRIS